MAKENKTIGRVPVSRHEYTDGATYYKDNIVTRYGSSFQCVVDSTTTPPATIDASGKVTLGEGWIFFADTSAISNAVAKHTEKITKLEEKTSIYNLANGYSDSAIRCLLSVEQLSNDSVDSIVFTRIKNNDVAPSYTYIEFTLIKDGVKANFTFGDLTGKQTGVFVKTQDKWFGNIRVEYKFTFDFSGYIGDKKYSEPIAIDMRQVLIPHVITKMQSNIKNLINTYSRHSLIKGFSGEGLSCLVGISFNSGVMPDELLIKRIKNNNVSNFKCYVEVVVRHNGKELVYSLPISTDSKIDGYVEYSKDLSVAGINNNFTFKFNFEGWEGDSYYAPYIPIDYQYVINNTQSQPSVIAQQYTETIDILNSNFESKYPYKVINKEGIEDISAKGDPHSVVKFSVPLQSKFNIRFKFKIADNVVGSNKIYNIFSCGNAKVKVIGGGVYQFLENYEVDGVKKQSKYPCFAGGVRLNDNYTSIGVNRLHCGEIAFYIRYKGDASSATITNTGNALNLYVNSTVEASFLFKDYPTLLSLVNAIDSLELYEAKVRCVEGYTPYDIVKFNDIELTSLYYSNTDGSSSSSTKTEYRDNAPLFIPLAKDDSWHQAEIVCDGTNIYSVVDGVVNEYLAQENEDNTIVEFGHAECGIFFKDIEIVANSMRDAEIKDYVKTAQTVKKVCISEINPYCIIFEGHGVYDGAQDSAFDDQDGLSVTTDRLSMLFSTLKSSGYVPVSMQDIIDFYDGKKNLPRKCYSIIFDDWRFDNVLDIELRKPFTEYGVQGQLAVVSDRYDQEYYRNNLKIGNEVVSIEKAVKVCEDNGFKCISHTRNHRYMTGIKPSQYITESKQDLIDGALKSIDASIVVLPYGAGNAYLYETFRWLGMKGAVNVETSANIKMSNKYNLYRYDIGKRTELSKLLISIL